MGISRVYTGDRSIERAHLRSTGKVFGGKQLVAFGFQSVGHVGGRKSRERVLSVLGGISSREREKSKKWNVQVEQCGGGQTDFFSWTVLAAVGRDRESSRRASSVTFDFAGRGRDAEAKRLPPSISDWT